MLFLLFVLVPLSDLALLVWLSGQIGVGTAIALTLLTGALGSMMARREGLRVITEYQRALTEGRRPEQGIIDGVLVLLGGALLITPGVLTDTVGLVLLLPPGRRLVARWVRKALDRHLQVIRFQPGMRSGPPGPRRPVQPHPGPNGHDGPRVVDTSGEALDSEDRAGPD